MAGEKSTNLGAGFPPFSSSRMPQLETLPARRTIFPKAGSSAASGGIIGAAPTSPHRILEETIASYPVSRMRLESAGLLLGIQWKSITVDRPTILQSVYTEEPSTTIQAPVSILYNYGRIPDNPNPQPDQVQVAEKGGICYLSRPGKWWIAATSFDVEQSQRIDCLIVDASDLETAARYLRQPGVNGQMENNYALTDPTVATLIPFGGRYVKAVTVQNVPPSGGAGQVVRYVVGQPTTTLVAAGVWTGVGFRLLVNGAVTFAGDALTRFGLYAVLESAGASNLEVVQYRDL